MTAGSRDLKTLARRFAWPIAAAALFLAALGLLRNELGQHTLDSVWRSFADLPALALALALAFTVLDYVVLVGYEALALEYAGKEIRLRRAALASTTGYAFSQALGFPLLTGAPIRYRMYTSWGLDQLDVARMVAFLTVTFWLGFLAFGGAVILVAPVQVPADVIVALSPPRWLGVPMMFAAVGYVLWCLRVRRPLRLHKWVFPVPTGRIAALQVGVASLEWFLSACVLWALLPTQLGLGFGETITLFTVAYFVGLISHVPGGLGVFEAVILVFLPEVVSESQVLGSLLAYRVIFYLVPLLIGAVLLAISEVRASRAIAGEAAGAVADAVSSVAPRVLAGLTFLTGALLVLSGAVPLSPGTRDWWSSVLPLPVLELSHFSASIVGAWLLVLARGIQRRLDGAYHLALILVVVGMAVSVSHGFRAAELAPLGVLLFAIVASRREFHRKASLLAESFTPAWIVATALVLVTSLWLGAFAYARVEYTSELWWTFTLNGNAPRFLRSMVAATSVLGLFGVARLLRPADVVHTSADSDVLDRIEPIVAAAECANAHLALLGDKQILLSESGRSFIMYGVERSSWIAMGDPVGDPAEFRALGWRFRAMAELAGDSPAFYQVTTNHLPVYLDLGLTLLKLGEEAYVELGTFTLQGPRRADLRKAIRRFDELGGSFEIVPKDDVPELWDVLAGISGAWLESKDATEKGFSLGSFRRDYLARQPLVLVRVAGVPVAFGNLWRTDGRDLSIDLMRYGPEAPRSTMDYLFAKLIEWGQQQGFERMGLGMAPLSGLESHPLATLWHRVGAAIFRHGGHFYNFQGLRSYKEKFDPVWEDRYLASPPNFALPRVLADVTSLISSGSTGTPGD